MALTKFGKRFERNGSIRQVKAEEGDLILHGRFGNSINLGSNDNSPVIKIRSGQRTDVQGIIKKKDSRAVKSMKNIVNRGGPIPEDINKDKNSIYLSTGKKYIIRNSNSKFNPLEASGNSIIVNSDSLIFNGRNGNVNIRASKNLVLEGDEVFIKAAKGQTIKMGDPRGLFMPTIDAMVMMEFMTEVMDVLNKGFAAIGKATNPPGLVSAAKDIATIVAKQIPRILEILTAQLFFNKSVMVQDPRFKIPELPFKLPEVPELPNVDIPKIPELKVPKLPEIPGTDNLTDLDNIEKLKELKRS